MKKDVALILTAKALRTFCYGFMGVLLPIYLTHYGFGKKEIGFTFSLTLIASAMVTWGVASPAKRYGIRKTLIVLHGVAALSGVLFLGGQNVWVLVLAAMIGNLAVGVGETGPFLALEQVALTRAVETNHITSLLSLYNLLGYVCAAAGGVLVTQTFQHPKILFAIFMGSGVAQSLLCFLYQEIPSNKIKTPRFNLTAKPFIRKIAALFALDAFGGGFILQSWVIYWFYMRFGLELNSLGWIYFSIQLATGISLLAASPLSKRYGLINTMVFSHLISNFFLLAVGLSTKAPIAILFLILRHLSSQIDVPTRQAFLMLAVPDGEREKASTVTGTSRTIAQAISPSLAGWITQIAPLSIPFFMAGGTKIIYDFFLYRAAKPYDSHRQ